MRSGAFVQFRHIKIADRLIGPLGMFGMAMLVEDSHPRRTNGPALEDLLSSFPLPSNCLPKKSHESDWRNLIDCFGWTPADPLIRTLCRLNAHVAKGFRGDRDATNFNGSVSAKYTPLSYYWFGSISFSSYAEEARREPGKSDFASGFGVGKSLRVADPRAGNRAVSWGRLSLMLAHEFEELG